MKRDIQTLASREYDVLIVGAGIYGACITWDAALRGLSVALIDKGDFGNATSANSLKTIHGGLRYLQDANLKLVRTMIGERKALLRIAPHLVRPLPCLMPTYNTLLKNKLAMRVALTMNDLIGFDRNRGLDPHNVLPPSRVLSREECLALLPGMADDGITGGALWHDGQMYNSERLLLSFVLGAVQHGATVANYVEATDLTIVNDRVTGVQARDVLTGNTVPIRAKLVVNAAGPWAQRMLDHLAGRRKAAKIGLSIAMNMVTRQFITGTAAGITSRYKFERGKAIPVKKPQLLFIAPWRSYSLVGTIHTHFEGRPEDYKVSEDEIQNFVDEVNAAYPGAQLQRDDVYFVHKGFLPAEASSSHEKVKLVREGQIYDHQTADGVDGLVTVLGVKYTSARGVAQQAVDVLFRKLGKTVPPCQTHRVPVHGGKIDGYDGYLAHEQRRHAAELPPEVVQHLVQNYGSEYNQVLQHRDHGWNELVSEGAQVITAEVLHGVREEQAQHLSDVIFRRTELGSGGNPGEACLEACASIMAAELGWDTVRLQRELDETRAAFRFGAMANVAQSEPLVEV